MQNRIIRQCKDGWEVCTVQRRGRPFRLPELTYTPIIVCADYEQAARYLQHSPEIRLLPRAQAVLRTKHTSTL